MWIIVYLILLACMSFIGSKEFKGINLIHYPYDFLVIIVLALVFYRIGITSHFKSVYYKRAKKINKQMKEDTLEAEQQEPEEKKQSNNIMINIVNLSVTTFILRFFRIEQYSISFNL